MDLQGYDHCMPYGQYSPSVPNPLVSSTVPLACKLSPLHPGYVMTVCAEEVVMKERSANAHVDIENNMSGI